MSLVRRIAYAVLAALLTLYSAQALWGRIEYLPHASQAIDPQPWKTIWLGLSIGVLIFTPAGVVGMWIAYARRAYRWMAACMALQLLFPVIIEQLQGGGI